MHFILQHHPEHYGSMPGELAGKLSEPDAAVATYVRYIQDTAAV